MHKRTGRKALRQPSCIAHNNKNRWTYKMLSNRCDRDTAKWHVLIKVAAAPITVKWIEPDSPRQAIFKGLRGRIRG